MNCENDYLEIREAYVKEPITKPVDLEGDYGAILSKPVCGTNNPGTIQSAGNMVWVHFKSDDKRLLLTEDSKPPLKQVCINISYVRTRSYTSCTSRYAYLLSFHANSNVYSATETMLTILCCKEKQASKTKKKKRTTRF